MAACTSAGPAKKQAGAFGHQDVVAHQRQVRAAGHAHAHDGGELRNAHGAHHRVVAEDAAEIVGVGKDVFLQRKKHAGGVDQINRRDVIFDGDILRANDFLRGHREKRAGFHGGVVGDDHERAAADAREPGYRSGRRRAAPLFVHFVGGENAQLEKLRAGIDQLRDAFARREPAFLVLRFDGFRAAALANLLFFVLDLGEEIDDAAVVFFEVGRLRVDAGFQDGRSHSQTSRRDSHRRAEAPSHAKANSIRFAANFRERPVIWFSGSEIIVVQRSARIGVCSGE